MRHPAFFSSPLPLGSAGRRSAPAMATHRRPRHVKCPVRMAALPLQERVLRLERALAAAVMQERYGDAASLRDALAEARTADPVLHKRAQLTDAVESEDFALAARLRDELAALTECFSRGEAGRRVDRIIVLRGRGDADTALRVATVSREGDVELGLVPPAPSRKAAAPRVYLQPTWSPSGDFVAMTEISFDLDSARALNRGVAIADSSSRVVIMNAFDGTVVKSAPLLKPPFFYFWSPDGRCVTLLSNDPTSPVTTVALSVMQVVAPPGASGLDLDTVTGPLASGHPFLFDFCPRDSGRVVAHMGDSSSVAVVPVSRTVGKYTYLTKNAGAFGAPQWHPHAGKDGREVVLFVEHDSVPNSNKSAEVEYAVPESDLPEARTELEDAQESDENDAPKKEAIVDIETLLSTGGTLLENVLRKGAESLGLSDPKPLDESSEVKSDSTSDDPKSTVNDEKDETFPEKFRRLLPKKETTPAPKDREVQWGASLVPEQPINRLVMCDVNEPELRKTIARFSGVMAFKLSPDGTALATLVTNPSTGQDELTVCTGEFSPDSVAENVDSFGFRSPRRSDNEADVILSTPQTRVLAFFWSPDATKLLFLTSLRGSRVGAAQWATFDRDSNRVVRYEKFVISGIYMHCLNFFDQFGASMTPWSPDSDAFCYPGRPLTQAELDREQSQAGGGSPALSALFLQREGMSDGKRFSARVQRVPSTIEGKVEPEEPTTIVENVEYACWSLC